MKHINKFNSINEALNSTAYSPNVSLVLCSSNPDNIVYTNVGNGEEIIFVNDNGCITGQKTPPPPVVTKAISEMTREEVHRYLYGENIDTIQPNDGTILGDYRGLYPQGDSIIGVKPWNGFDSLAPFLLPWTFVEFLSMRLFDAEYTPFEITSLFCEDIIITLEDKVYIGKFADLLSVIIQYTHILVEDENGNVFVIDEEEQELERVGAQDEDSVFFGKPVFFNVRLYPFDGIVMAPLLEEDGSPISALDWEDDSNAFYLTWKNPGLTPYDSVEPTDTNCCRGDLVRYAEQFIYYGHVTE